MLGVGVCIDGEAKMSCIVEGFTPRLVVVRWAHYSVRYYN